MSESIVLCEGFYDRAFWAGWLLHLGYRQAAVEGEVFVGTSSRAGKGHFGYFSKSEQFLKVVPCHGRPHILRQARLLLGERDFEPRLRRLVLCVDPDVDTAGDSAATGLRVQDVLALARQYDESAAPAEGGDVLLDDGSTAVSLVRWEVPGAGAAGVPTVQTLERLICSAIVAVYPGRGPAVGTWLDSRPGDPPDAGPKEFAWSHMAGWYAEHGCSDFFQAVWRDEAVRDQLRFCLTESGAWRVAEALAE